MENLNITEEDIKILKKKTEEERNKEKKKTFIGKNNDTGHMESHMLKRRHPRLTTEVFKFNPG